MDCLSCAVGRYVATSGSISPNACSVCNSGTYAPIDGAARCTVCAAGRYLADGGTAQTEERAAKHDSDTDCTACPKGRYMIDQDSFVNEGAQQFMEIYNLDKIDALGRKHSSEDSCLFCYGGTFSDKEASSSCTTCPVSYSLDGPRARSTFP